MGVTYQAVQWNRQKIIYDGILLLSVAFYIYGFIAISGAISDTIDIHGVRIRAYGSAAFILLHVILSIGPLSRLSPKFNPLLFNRRHMGVTMFFLALIHVLGLDLPILDLNFNGALTWYHDFGNLDPMVSLLTSNTDYGSLIRFPYESLGILALFILFVMAATSHDFWLANLTAPVWKALHMSVYVAYGLLVGHVVLGALQTNKHILLTVLVFLGMIWILGIHWVAGFREYQKDQQKFDSNEAGFVDVGSVHEIRDNRAKVVVINGERVAVFKYDGKVSAVSNVCQHQNGPLGEGKIIDGCITCPWHGYQYRPESGSSPPPFHEKIPTFDVRINGDRILVNHTPNLPGTPVKPAQFHV